MKPIIVFVFIIFICSWPIIGHAQRAYPTGLQLDDEEYRKLAHGSENIQIDSGRKSLTRKVDLTPFCPAVGDQGDIASCVGWSLGYAAMTIERAIRNRWPDQQTISEKANSALFIYNQINQGDCLRGVSMPNALKFVKEKGNCLARDFDAQASDCQEEVPGSLVKEAEAYKIEDFIPLFLPEAGPEEKIKKIKLVLAQNKPVLVGMILRRNFFQIKAGEQSWWPGLGDTLYAGSHAMTVVGYDDDRFKNPRRALDPDMEGAFRLMNSWGGNWGDAGFIWVRYAHFAEFCRHAFAIRLAQGDVVRLEEEAPEPEVRKTQPEENQTTPSLPVENPVLQLSGTFSFRHFQGWDQSSGAAIPLFKEEAIRLVDDDHYTLEGSRRPGDQFQLQVQSDFDNGYVYVLSVDPTGKTEVHFPKSEDYNLDFKGLNESALLMFSGSLLTIPSRKRVLELKQVGADHLIVLFSRKKIMPEFINRLCRELSQNQGQLMTTLYEILGKTRVPPGDITYLSREMGFEVSTRSEGIIVPIVLTVNVGS